MLFRMVGPVKADLLLLLPNTAQLNTFFSFSKGELEKSSVGLLLWAARSPDWLKTVLSWIAKPFVRSISF